MTVWGCLYVEAALFYAVPIPNGHFDDAVPAVFEEVIGRFDLFKGEGVGNQRRGIQPSGGKQGQNFAAAAAVHAAVLKVRFLPYISGSGSV